MTDERSPPDDARLRLIEATLQQHQSHLERQDARLGRQDGILQDHGAQIQWLRSNGAHLSDELTTQGKRLERIEHGVNDAKRSAEEAKHQAKRSAEESKHEVRATGEAMIKANNQTAEQIRDAIAQSDRMTSETIRTQVATAIADLMGAIEERLGRQDDDLAAIRRTSETRVSLAQAQRETERARNFLKLIALVGSMGILVILVSLKAFARLELDDKYIFGVPTVVCVAAVYLINAGVSGSKGSGSKGGPESKG